jgi:Leucine-rich repeat (LRR) protein
MKTNKTIKTAPLKTLSTKTMKKLILLLLFVSGFAFAQPVINNPEPYQVCDDNGDGFAAFDLNLITPTLITVQGTEISYYETLTDSQTGANPINLLVPFTNSTPFNQTIYIRAIDIANPSIPAYTTLNVVVSQKPGVTMSNTSNCVGNSITITTTVNGTSTYNYSYSYLPLGVLNPGNVASFATSIDGSYYVTVTDVVTGCVSNLTGIYVALTPLPVATINVTSVCDSNPASVSTTVVFVNNPSYSWTVPSGATDPGNTPNFMTSVPGNYAVTVTDNTTGCVSNQVSTTVITQTSVAPTFTIPPSTCPGFILPTTSDNGISGTWSPAFLVTDTYVFTPTFGQCATIYSIFITVNDAPNANQAPNLVQNTTNNNAVFDLTSQNSLINNGSGIQFGYFLSLADAQNNSNGIVNPASYTNIANPQTIYVRVVDPSLGICAATTSFDLVINNPNNVYIPDANFKARLISLGVDTNFDGEIQFTEAAFTNEINVSGAQIADLTGIEAFTNITVLRCNQNSLTGLNINNLTNLETLDCSNNQITSLNISNLINLKNLICISNLLTSLDVSPLTLLEELNFYNNQVTTINVDALLNLKKLNCSYNRILLLNVNNLPILERLECVANYSTSFTISNLPNLKYLDCAYNYYLVSLNLTQFPLLEYIDCRGDGLTTLSISNLNNLITLYADSNGLTTIDLSNLPNLSTLYVNYNQLTSLNLAGLTNLSTLFCLNNQLAIINFAGLNGLSTVYCDNNLLTSLDFSLTPNLSILSCSYNNLSTINIKNGTNSFNSGVLWSQNPLLNFVCCDDGELAAVNQIISQSQNSNNGNVVFNSYCSFVPGGNFNTITGQIKLDANNNGCDAGDNSQPLIRVNINDGFTQGATVTDANGNYTFYTTAGFFTIAPEVDNPSSFNFSPPTASVSFGSANSNVATQNFCINQNGSFQDVEIVIEPIDFARPGSTATYKIVYKNKGNTLSSGSLNLTYNDLLLNFTTATVTPVSQNSGVLNWTYTNLQPFESRSFEVTFLVNSISSNPPVNAGTTLNFNPTITPIGTDENQNDNQFNYNQVVVNSYLPNAITCLQGELVSSILIGDYLHYSVRFENTGNYLAQNVVIKIEIDIANYDINSLQVLNSSNPVYTRITGNIIEFIFDNINLESASGNPPVGGHGDVLFRIRTNNQLVSNSTVLQTAKVYYDYKFPLTTNDAETTFAALNNPNFELDNSVKVYPNPSKGNVNINCNFNIKSIELYDVQGRILETNLVNDVSKTIDISTKQNGIYFIKITTDKGIKVEKLIKE